MSARAIGLRLALLALLASASALFAGYRIENVPLPAGLRGGVSSIAFTPRGTLVVTTRHGEVWMRAVEGAAWHRFTSGLNEPMGLVAESESVVFVAHRPELLRCADTDGDGIADDFSVLGGQWGLSQNYHEFFFGLRRDAEGNFLGALSLESTGDKSDDDMVIIRGPANRDNVLTPTGHRSETMFRGWAIRITPDGKFEPLAAGLRQPNGVGLSPGGDFFLTDNQGDWKFSGGVTHVEPGDFFGHAASLKWEPGFGTRDLSAEELWRRFKAPAVVLPHGAMGISNGEIVWDLTRGRFGPFAGQVFVGDNSACIMRVTLERVAGAWQGACYPFIGRFDLPGAVTGEKLQGGGTRMAFGPDGALYLAQTAGWGAGHDGVQRISWDAQPTPEIASMQLTSRGFAVTFTEPMDARLLAQLSNYELRRFRYYYHAEYGSPRIDEARVTIHHIEVDAAARRVELGVEELPVGFVYELSVPQLRTAAGAPLLNPLAFYTANRLLSGEIAIGGATRLPRADEKSLGLEAALNAERATAAELVPRGEQVYRLYCVACHQANGRGLPGGAADFVGDATRLAKTDEQLLASIRSGVETKGMPAFGSVLSTYERAAVLAYIRATFGSPAAR